MASIQELESQISQGQNQLLNRTSPLAFSQILQNALKSRFGKRSEELEASRETSRSELGKVRQSLTGSLSPDELRNINPAQQRELVQGERSGLEASIARTQEESQRIEGTSAEQIEQGRLMQEDIQNNMITRLNFLKEDLGAQKDKQSEFKQLAFGLASTGVPVTPEIEKMLDGLSNDEKEIWLSQNAATLKGIEDQKALDYARLANSQTDPDAAYNKLVAETTEALKEDLTDPSKLLDGRGLATDKEEIGNEDLYATREELVRRAITKYGHIIEPADIEFQIYSTHRNNKEISDPEFLFKAATDIYGRYGITPPPDVQNILSDYRLPTN